MEQDKMKIKTLPHEFYFWEHLKCGKLAEFLQEEFDKKPTIYSGDLLIPLFRFIEHDCWLSLEEMDLAIAEGFKIVKKLTRAYHKNLRCPKRHI
jgi:hypothetical protein